MASELNGLASSFGRVEQSAARMDKIGGALVGIGAGVTGASIGLQRLVTKSIEVGNYADGIASKLKAMLAVRGESGAYDELMALSAQMQKLTGQSDEVFSDASSHLLSFGLNARQIAQILPGMVGQANTMGQSLNSVADSFGKAFASGNAGALTKSGLVLSQADKEAIDYAKGISEAATQQAVFNASINAYAKYATKAGEGISRAARAQNYFNQLKGDAQEQFGQGAAEAQTDLYEKGAAMLEKLNASPQIIRQAGAWATYASAAGQVVGPLTTVAGLAYKIGAARQLSSIAKSLQSGGGTHAAGAGCCCCGGMGSGGGMGGGGKGGGGKGGGAGGAAGKAGIGAGLLKLVKMPATVAGRGASTATAFGSGGGAVTMGSAALSVGLGVGAGVQASGNMKAAGYSDSQSYWYGAATGLGAAAVSAFVPGGPLWVAMGMAGAGLANKLINEPAEALAEAGTGAEGELLTRQNEANRGVSRGESGARDKLAAVYDEMAANAKEAGDELQALSYTTQAANQRTQAAKDAADPRRLDARRRAGASRDAASNGGPRGAELEASLAARQREVEAMGLSYVSYDKGEIKGGRRNTNVDKGITDPRAGAVRNNRDGSQSMVIQLPERAADRANRKLSYNTRTPSPNYVN
jgi:hypothetical protein